MRGTSHRPFTIAGTGTAGVVFLVLVGFLPDTNSVFWPPKAALVLLMIPLGFPRLLWLAGSSSPSCRTARAPARAALAFLVVAALSALFADTRTTAVFGLYLWGTGLLFVAALASAWAIGATLEDGERRLVTGALLAGVAVNAVVAILQMVADMSSIDLTRFDGRSPGIQGNPVHLGALVAAGVVLALPWQGRRLLPWLGLLYAMAAAVQVSGSRSALLAMVVTIGAAMLAGAPHPPNAGRRTAGRAMVEDPRIRLGWRRSAMVVLAITLGLTAGAGLSEWGGGFSVSERVASTDGGGGVTPRISMWWASRHAVADAPVLGSGPGTYREATSRYRTITVARAFGADLYFTDAHNLIVEYATTTGLLGLGFLVAWMFWAWRRAGGPLRLFALGLFLAGLVEPQSPGTTPMLFLALGLALRPTPPAESVEQAEDTGSSEDAGSPESAVWVSHRAPTLSRRVPRLVGATSAVLAVPALAAGAIFIDGEYHFEKASHGLSRSDAEKALNAFPAWSYPATVRAIVERVRGNAEGGALQQATAERWFREAVRRDPTDPALWLQLGGLLMEQGEFDGAGVAYLEALKHNPVSTAAPIHLGELANAAGDTTSAIKWLEQALAVVPEQPNIRQALQDLRRKAERSP